MRKTYVVNRPAKSYEWWEDRPQDHSSITIYEEREFIPIGVLDKDGNEIMTYSKPHKIGFLRFKDKA